MNIYHRIMLELDFFSANKKLTKFKMFQGIYSIYRNP